MSQLFAWSSQSTGGSALAPFPPKKSQGWSPSEWTSWIFLQSKSLLQHHTSKASTLRRSAFFTVQLSHPYMTTGKTIALTMWTFVSKVLSLLLNVLSRFVITFLTRSKGLLISWPQSQSATILEPKKIKSVTVSVVSPSICMKWRDWMPWSLFFECWVLSQLFHSPLSLSSRGSLIPFCFLP